VVKVNGGERASTGEAASPGVAESGAQQCSEESTGCGLSAESGPEPFMEYSLDDLVTGPVMLDFFKPDCPACLRMVPVIESVRATCAGEGLRVEKIDLSRPGNLQIARQMGVVGTPTLVLLDEEGKEVSRLVGVQELETVQRAIAVLMGGACADFSRFR